MPARGIAVKVADARSTGGDQLGHEADVYRRLSASNSRVRIPEYYGAGSTRTHSVLAIERGMFSLDRLARIEPTPAVGTDATVPVAAGVVCELATLAADCLLTTVLELARCADRRGAVITHGDIRPANLLAVRRGGVVDVVLADWGLAAVKGGRSTEHASLQVPALLPPEAREPDRRWQPGPQTDLWAAGLALWQLLHHGSTPFRLRDDSELLLAGDSLLNNADLTFVVDVDCCGSVCVFDGDGDDAAHRLAADLLRNPDRLAVAEEARLGIREAADGLRARQRQALAGARPLERRLHYIDVELQHADQVPDWLPLGLPSTAVLGVPDPLTTPGLRPRMLTWWRRLGGLDLRGGLVAVLGGVALGLFVGLLAGRLVMPYPTLGSTAAQTLLAAACTVAVSVLAAVVVGVTWRLRCAATNRTRPNLVMGSTVAAVAAVTVVVALRYFLVPGLSWSVLWWAAAGSALSGVLWSFAAVCALDLSLNLRDRALSGRGRWYMAAVAVGVCVVLVAGTAQTDTTHNLVADSVDRTISGQTGKPVFFNPDDLAVAPDGSVAVLERFGAAMDVVWLGSPDGRWRPVLRASITLAPQSLQTDQTAPQRAVSWVAERQGGDPWAAGKSTGDPLTGIASIDFVSNDELAVLGPDGISLAKLSPDGSTVVRRLSSQPRTAADSSLGKLLVSKGTIYVNGYDTDAFAKDPSTADVAAQGKSMSICPQDNYSFTPSASVAQLDLTGHVSLVTWTNPDATGSRCMHDVLSLVDTPDGVGYIIETWGKTADQKEDSDFQWLITLVSPPSPAETPGRPQQVEQLPLVGPGISTQEVLAAQPSSGITDATMSNGRLFVKTDDCSMGFDVSGSTMALPQVMDRTWYGTDVASYGCRPSPDDGTVRGFIGASLDSLKQSANNSGGGTGSTGTGTADTSTSCIPPNGGVSDLDVYGWKQTPWAVGPDGTVYVASDAARACTSIVWRLRPAGTQWIPMTGLTAQRSPDSTMFAENVTTSPTGFQWYAPGQFQMIADDGSASFNQGLGNTSRFFDAHQATFKFGTVTMAPMRLSSEDPWPTADQTRLAFKSTASKTDGTQLAVHGATDMARVADDELVVARCGQILRLDPNTASLTAHTGLIDPPDGVLKVVAGSTALDAKSLSAPCAAVNGEPLNIQDGVEGVEMLPVAVDGVRTTAGSRYVYGEYGTYPRTGGGSTVVSRVRIVEVGGAAGAKGRIYTLGCGPDTHSSVDYDGTCSGDLGELGLIPSDVAIDSRGVVAVTTRTTTGWGPVLIFSGGRRHVLSLDPSILATSVAWAGGKLVITDGARGNVYVTSPAVP